MLAAYDSQLRLDAEAQGALARRLLHWYPREGVLVEASAVPEGAGDGPFLPVMTAVFAGEAGFISHGAVGQQVRVATDRPSPSVISPTIRSSRPTWPWRPPASRASARS
ncbi:MAG: hypothetical protein J7474_04120, partial [Arthrobacter sp.]|nr:hypothetical protein [Arthrobacter sp.]